MQLAIGSHLRLIDICLGACMVTPDSDLYEKWLKFVFDRPVTRPQWFFRIDADFEATKDQLVELIGGTFRRSGTDLLRFSDAQVDDGLNYILFPIGSNNVFSICQKGVALDKRIAAVLHMKTLYRDCYAKRCAPVLSHFDEPGSNALNHTCYMLWDASPIRSWKSVVLDVMQSGALSSEHCLRRKRAAWPSASGTSGSAGGLQTYRHVHSQKPRDETRASGLCVEGEKWKRAVIGPAFQP